MSLGQPRGVSRLELDIAGVIFVLRRLLRDPGV